MNLKETIEDMANYPTACVFRAIWDGDCPDISCRICTPSSIEKLLEMLDREYVPKELDSLEKIEQDAEKSYANYWGCIGFGLCEECPAEINGEKPYQRYGARDCVTAQRLDLLHRQRELLEGE